MALKVLGPRDSVGQLLEFKNRIGKGYNALYCIKGSISFSNSVNSKCLASSPHSQYGKHYPISEGGLKR